MHYDSFVRRALPAYDLNWRKYRRRQSRRGVHERMNELGLPAYEDYLAYLGAHPEEAEVLIERMRVTVTRFFRDRRCWEDLAEHALPDLANSSDGLLRALSVGCAGGEEPYSLAMLWLERFADRYPDEGLEILALDMDRASLDRARAGLYPPGSLKEADPGLRQKYFVPEKGMMRLDASVRDMVRFQRREVAREPLPHGFDLVLCRYLFFTYFTGKRLRRAAEELHDCLRPGGLLMTGRKEEVPAGLLDLFTPLPTAGPCLHSRP
jgi:chemotaxis methyl-accepting protein methylase